MKTYDVVAIGNSPKVFIELLKYAKKGKKTLLISANSNWNTIKFSSKNVEDGCFFIDYKKLDYKLLSKYLNIKLKKVKNEPSFIYKKNLYPISSNFLDGDDKATKIYRYPQNGLLDIKKTIQREIKLNSIELLNIELKSLFIDFEKKSVYLNQNIKTKKLLSGYNLNLLEIKSNKSDLILNRVLENYFTYCIVEVEISHPLNFSLIDFSYCKNNKLPKNIKNKIIFFEKNLNKFIWRVKDLTPFTSLNNKDNHIKILCIDTMSWLPKKEFEKDITIEIFNYLKDKKIIKDFKINKFIYKSKKSFSIKKSVKTIEKLYHPYIKIVNPLFFDKDKAK